MQNHRNPFARQPYICAKRRFRRLRQTFAALLATCTVARALSRKIPLSSNNDPVNGPSPTLNPHYRILQRSAGSLAERF
jgi:hypothetical protein